MRPRTRNLNPALPTPKFSTSHPHHEPRWQISAAGRRGVDSGPARYGQRLPTGRLWCTSAAERRRINSKYVEDFYLKNGSSQGQNMALTVLSALNMLDSDLQQDDYGELPLSLPEGLTRGLCGIYGVSALSLTPSLSHTHTQCVRVG